MTTTEIPASATDRGNDMPMGSTSRSAYDRSRDLPRLLGLWPEEVARLDTRGLEAIVARLAAAIRTERRRARSRHWSYDLNRHWALITAFDSECATLRRRQKQRSLDRSGMDSGRPPAEAREAFD